ncbi:MAG: hypothetical protein U0R51_02400 [Solirubrobacterales bacterium]
MASLDPIHSRIRAQPSPAPAVIAEVARHHRGAQRDRDNARDVRHGRAGYLVRRYSGEALADEAAVAVEILAILRECLPAATSA